MFELTQETKDAIISYLRTASVVDPDVTDENLNVVIDNIVTIVKRQFGM